MFFSSTDCWLERMSFGMFFTQRHLLSVARVWRINYFLSCYWLLMIKAGDELLMGWLLVTIYKSSFWSKKGYTLKCYFFKLSSRLSLWNTNALKTGSWPEDKGDGKIDIDKIHFFFQFFCFIEGYSFKSFKGCVRLSQVTTLDMQWPTSLTQSKIPNYHYTEKILKVSWELAGTYKSKLDEKEFIFLLQLQKWFGGFRSPIYVQN